MNKQSTYTSRKPDARGVIHYSEQEHDTWRQLITRQLRLIENRACNEFMEGLERLNLPQDHIPQLQEVSVKLQSITGWQVAPVPALIEIGQFFKLLANKHFPVATFIRRPEDFDYLQEPDIFHEIFGHCPLLTNSAFANFTEAFGRLGLTANKLQQDFLARLYWFTVEFGLINTAQGLRIYGGGILSSPQEVIDSLESPEPDRLAFDLSQVLRTPYRIDIIQPVYYLLNAMTDLEDLRQVDLLKAINHAAARGLLPAKFAAA
jgi:phenylalanine-4-hydroxylase